MSVETGREFVDANILVYAYDSSAGAKKRAAEQLLAQLWSTGAGCLSVQVLQEFFVTVTMKVSRPLGLDEARDRVRDFRAWRVFAPTIEDVLGAISIQKASKLSFWDAMVVHAAAESGCDTLWSEDLNDRQIIRGVCIRNPFTE